MQTRPRLVLVVGLISIGLIGATSVGQAQPNLPHAVVVTNTQLSESQQNDLDRFISMWVDQLKQAAQADQGGTQNLSQARSRLTEPLRTPGATEVFKRIYSNHLAKHLMPLAKSQSLAARLNAAVLAQNMTSVGALGLAEAALSDKNSAVRYRGAKAVASIMKTMANPGQLKIKRKLALLKTLLKMGQNVQSPEVLKQTLVAMVSLDQPASPLPKAITQSLNLLSSRIKWHVNRPFGAFIAEHAGLRAVYHRLLNASNPDPKQVRQLAAVANRYMLLIAGHLIDAQRKAGNGGDNPIDPNEEKQHAQMLKLTNYILRWTYGQFKSQQGQPKSILRMITFTQWKKIRLIAFRWQDVLSAPPINVPKAQLRIVGDNEGQAQDQNDANDPANNAANNAGG